MGFKKSLYGLGGMTPVIIMFFGTNAIAQGIDVPAELSPPTVQSMTAVDPIDYKAVHLDGKTVPGKFSHQSTSINAPTNTLTTGINILP